MMAKCSDYLFLIREKEVWPAHFDPDTKSGLNAPLQCRKEKYQQTQLLTLNTFGEFEKTETV
jgi:hypothetical protein